jgi:hypothetical protein
MFRLGDTVVFDPDTLNKEFWENLPEQHKLKFYGSLGYGSGAWTLFTFITEHYPQAGHCMLVSMEDQHIETMRHTNNFRLVSEDEC